MWLEEHFKSGYKLSSAAEDIAISNIQAVSGFSDLVQTTLGPHRRQKFLINNISVRVRPLTRTTDEATVDPDGDSDDDPDIDDGQKAHLVAKMMVSASQSQQGSVYDGTKTVIILAGELLEQAEHLLVMGVHPSEISKGYELACRKALGQLETLSTMTLPTPLTLPTLTNALKPALASKQFGSEHILAALVAEAALAVMPTREKGFCVDDVRVVTIVGGSLSGSKVVRGMVFGRESEGTIKHTTAAKVAVFTCALDIAQTETKMTALTKNTDEIRREEELLAEIIKEIAASGIKVIIASSCVSDLALQYLNNHSIAVLKVLSKFELRRICRVVDAIPLDRIGMPTEEEEGWVDVYETVDIDGDRVTVLRQLIPGDLGFEKSGKRGDGKGKKTRTATIVLRGSNANNLTELESAIDDGMNLIPLLLRDRRLVAGAGATERELAKRVDVYGGKMKGQQRHVVKRFAMALEVIPRALAENAAEWERKGGKVVNPFAGEDEASGDIEGKPPSDGTILADSNSLSYPILDSLAVKRSAINHAMEVVVSVFNINSNLMGRRAARGNWCINTSLRIIFHSNNSAAFPSGPLDILLLFFLFIMILICFLMFYLTKSKTSFLDILLMLLMIPPVMVLLYYTFQLKSNK